MSLFKRGTVWWSRIVIDGEPFVQSLKTRDKNEARTFESLWRADRIRGEHGLGKAPTFNEFAKRFLNYLPGKVSRATYSAYISRTMSLLNYAPLADCRVDKIDTAVIEGFIAFQQKPRKGEPPYAVSSINARLRTLKRCLSLAAEWNVIRKAPKVAQLQGEHHREFIISETVLQQFLDKAPTDMHRSLWLFLYETGIRIGEACALVWDDIEGNPPTALHVRKGKTKLARRRVPLTKKAVTCLERLPRAASGFVFTRHGRSINKQWASTPFVAIRRELGLPSDCVTHSLRHSALTKWGNAGVSPFVLQRLAGHANIAMTARYSHPDDAQMDAAIARMD